MKKISISDFNKINKSLIKNFKMSLAMTFGMSGCDWNEADILHKSIVVHEFNKMLAKKIKKGSANGKKNI